MRILTISLLTLLAVGTARGQSSVSDCSLITDPTLQRTCLENFKQGGKARGLNPIALDDGAVPRIRSGRGPIPVVSGKVVNKRKKGGAAKGAPAASEDAPTDMP